MKLEWYALSVEQGRENVARHNLGLQRLRALLPLERGNLKSSSKRKATPLHNLHPLFPGYLFVRCRWDKQAAIVRATKAVTGFVGYRDGMKSALPIHPINMQALMDRLVEYMGWDVLGAPVSKIEEGMLVQALLGTFRYVPAPAHLVSGNRVELVYPLFGKTITQVYAIDDLQEVCPV